MEESIGELRSQIKQLSKQLTSILAERDILAVLIHKNIVYKTITDAVIINQYYKIMEYSGRYLLHQEQTQYKTNIIKQLYYKPSDVRRRNKEIAKIDIEYLRTEIDNCSKDITLLNELIVSIGLK